MDDQRIPSGRRLDGRLWSAGGRTELADIGVWLVHRRPDGSTATVTGRTGPDGSFALPLPAGPVTAARVGADLVGVPPVDLEATGHALESGEVVLVVDDLLPSHLRFGGA